MKYAAERALSLLFALALIIAFAFPGNAQDPESTEKYYMGTVVNAGCDTGFSEKNPIDAEDPHFGWELGQFCLSGYTRVLEGADPVFLKTAGDRLTLWFHLDQQLDALNGSEKLTVSRDENGYDLNFGLEKTDFGRGCLIIRRTDWQNQKEKPVIYTDFLAANAVLGADTRITLVEEGDYEVALDYEIREKTLEMLGHPILPTYTNYRIAFRFSVRNGNCMVFPFDASTGEELRNRAVTPNGFTLDLAKSRYLDVDVQKAVWEESPEGLVEDVRFNRPARDGERYTEEGVYTITVHNRYTDQTTRKLLYVGSNEVLKAHASTGLSVEQIEGQIRLGATVSEDGTLLPPPEMSVRSDSPVAVMALAVAVLLLAGLFLHRSRIRKKRHQKKSFQFGRRGKGK